MIHLENVCFAYNKQSILQDLNLNLPSGHVCGLLGENGVGKSTLLKCIAGTLFPDSGNILVQGLVPQDRQRKFLSDIFFIPEDFILPSLSISGYMHLYAPFYKNFDAALFFSMLKELEVPAQAHLDALSFGQRKKVLIAFGLACNTKVVLMDEPTNGLDIPSKAQFRKMMARTITTDRCFLISTHQVRDLDNLIDYLIVLKNQQVVVAESTAAIESRLSFQLSGHAPESAFYSERSLRGTLSVSPNTSGEESSIDIELFFKALLLNESAIRSVFN